MRHMEDSKIIKDSGVPADQELVLADQRGDNSLLEKRQDSMIQLDHDDLVKLTMAFPSANH